MEENIQKRITDLNEGAFRVQAVVPEWLQQNGAALDALHTTTNEATERDLGVMTRFSEEHARAVVSAKSAVDDFLKSPFEQGRTGALLSKVGATDATLPELPVDSVPRDAPKIDGITAVDAAYGSADDFGRRIALERRRLNRDIPEDGPDRNYANGLLGLAASFAGAASEAGAGIAEALIKDAAAARYFHEHDTPTLWVTVVDAQGKLAPLGVDGLREIPDIALSTRLRDFQGGDVEFGVQYTSQRSAISATDVDLARRKALLDTARQSENEAKRLYASGNLGGAWGKQLDAGDALDSERLVGTTVDKACKNQWLNCADAVNHELAKNPTDRSRLIHLALYWQDAFADRYADLRTRGELERAVPDSEMIYEEVKSKFNPWDIAKDKAVDKGIDYAKEWAVSKIKTYLPRIAPVLGLFGVGGPVGASVAILLKDSYDLRPAIATDYDDLLQRDIAIQRRIGGYFDLLLISDWRYRFGTAIDQAEPAIRNRLRLP